jgi:AraC-like DNA-binding protein
MKPVFEIINKAVDQSFYLEDIRVSYFTDLWHFHPEIEILYIREGNGIKYVGDSINPFYPGDIVIIGSDIPHVWVCNSDYLKLNSNLMASAVCIQFMADFIQKGTSDIPEMHLINEFLINAKRGIQFLNSTNNMLVKQIEELSSHVGMDRLISLLTILDLMSKSSDYKYLSSLNYNPGILNSEDKVRMETIFRYVIKNYQNKILLEEIASLVHLTPHSFCRYFKSRTTKVFSSFVKEVRIGNSCKMLRENKHTITQICYESGFNYLSIFNRQFKKIKGMTPSEYQSKYKNLNYDLMFGK